MAGKRADDSHGRDDAAALQAAAERLNAALDGLDAEVDALLARLQDGPDSDGSGSIAQDRARLAAELDAAQARAEMLEDAARDAGRALDAAIAEVRNALGEV